MRLYVGNIPFEATEAELRTLFEQFGSVTDLYYAMDKETGRPRGFAFVTYGDREAGAKALESLTGHELEGRALKANEVEEREPRPRGGGGGGNFRGGGNHRGGGRGGGREHRGGGREHRGGGRRSDYR